MLDDFNRRACKRTTPLLRCCRRVVHGCLLCLLWTLPALTAHLVGVPAEVTHHLKALIWNMLRDRCDKIARAEHLKVALDLRIHSRAIENRVAQAIHLHLRNRKWIANNVLRKSLNILTLMRRVANAVRVAERITQKVTHALMRDTAELLEQSAVKSKVRPQHLWNGECEMPMRHEREDRLRKHGAEYLHLFLMA